MGKKTTKKTRWRTLTLNGHQSDSEESSTPSSISHQNHRNYHNKYYSSKFTYSSHSTPIRKYQNDSSKTTRSNSTTSEHKTTFNEDEYTRITTPRQDVLFKKGYLNKPKSYQTQTSTGTSSTANSTSTCTPDHQSADGTEGTDLEYESQFVFPNGFIDHNGIYYINSYEPFPFVVYNAPFCYPEYPPERTKRYSTDSAADSVSPHNEEVAVVQNGVEQPADYYHYNNATASDNSNEEPRRPKKKRRRKVSRTKEEGNTSCDSDSSDVAFDETESTKTCPVANDPHHQNTSQPPTDTIVENDNNDHESKPSDNVSQTLLLQSLTKQTEEDVGSKHPLKADAQEFIPRTLHTPAAAAPELPYEPSNIQYVNFAHGYIPVPFINHNPTFLPPGIPINYVPIQEPKFVNVIVPSTHETKEVPQADDIKVPEVATQTEPIIVTEQNSPKKAHQQQQPIDIARIVSKLEEAVMEQSKRESNNKEWQVTAANRKGRYQYQKKRAKQSFEKPKTSSQPPIVNNRDGNQLCTNLSNDYSATLKKKMVEVVKKPCSRYDKTLEPAASVSKQRAVNNQWISVSSRKKKRKGVIEEQEQQGEVYTKENEEETEQQDTLQNEDLFESYDVNMLEDVVVVPPTNEESLDTKPTEEEAAPSNESVMEVPEVVQNCVVDESKSPKTTEDELTPPPPPEAISTKKELPKKSNTTTKRVMQKLPIKRIFIKDDIQQQVCNEDKVEDPKPEMVKQKQQPEPETKPLESQPVAAEKKKKKKKKVVVVVKLQSTSSSTTTLSNIDDSYDFLLENSIMEDSDQKTNLEMSAAFDLMIQKGMYNNLEEKIKALKIGGCEDGFFRAIDYSTFKTPPTPSKQIFAPPQFDTFFQKDVLRTEANLKTTQSSSTSSTGSAAIFLENPTVNELIKNAAGSASAAQETTQYPITQAVKNWLTKTRENTPEVELLKSPNAIYKELGTSEPAGDVDDEVTLWSVSSQNNSLEEDLLDCWENEPAANDTVTPTNQPQEVNGYHHNGLPHNLVEEGEDAIEIYESNYGKNEDYLKLKAEIEEQQQKISTSTTTSTNRNFPRHGNLPYRAICCNIM